MSHHLYDWKPIFLEALADVPVVSHACKAVGISYRHAYKTRETDEDFAKAWDEAMEQGVDRAEQEAFRRAVVGFEEPVIDKGRLAYRYERVVAEDGAETYRVQLDSNGQPVPLTVRKHSDALMALMLKGRRKKVYADRTELTGPEGGPVQQIDETAKAARLAQLMAIAQQRKDFEDLA
jgi:hypothetical protein